MRGMVFLALLYLATEVFAQCGSAQLKSEQSNLNFELSAPFIGSSQSLLYPLKFAVTYIVGKEVLISVPVFFLIARPYFMDELESVPLKLL